MSALKTGKKTGKGYYIIMLSGLILISLFENIGLFEGIDNYCYDLSFRLRGFRPPSDRIVIVSIDEETLENLGSWPIKRRCYATLLDKLSEADIVSFDIIMAEPTRDDAILAEAIRGHGRVLLPVYLEEKKKKIVRPAPSLSPRKSGHLHVERDIDWVVRSAFHTIYYDKERLPSLSSVIYETATGDRFHRDELSIEDRAALRSHRIVQKDPMRINYYGSPEAPRKNAFTTYSFSDVIDDADRLPSFKGKIVLVGVAAEGIGDRKLTPFSELRRGSPGVYVHAALLNNLMDKTDIALVPEGMRLIIALLLSLSCLLLFLKMGEKKSTFFWLSILSLVALSIHLLHSARHLWVNPAAFCFSVTFIYIFAYVLRLDIAARELDRAYAAIGSSLGRKARNSKKTPGEMGLFGYFTTGGVNSRTRMLGRVMSQLLFEKALTEAALNSDIHGIMLYDAAGRLIVANNRARRIFQNARVEVEAIETFKRDVAPCIMEQAPLDDVIKGRDGRSNALTLSLGGREKIFLKMDVSPLDFDRETYLFFAFTDITKIKELELLKGQMASMVSHELKSPMTAIQGFSELLMENLEGEERDFAEIIHKESGRLTRFINTFLDISRIEAGGQDIRKEPVHLPGVVQEVIQALEPVANRKKITMAMEASPEMIVVAIDMELTKQCIFNLVENAIKYSPAGSDVRIRLTEEEDRSLIDVIDNGDGVDETDVDRIFDRFYRGSRAMGGKEGSGLGLAFVKDAVEAQGGVVSVKSAPGKGAAFTISFPKTAL